MSKGIGRVPVEVLPNISSREDEVHIKAFNLRRLSSEWAPLVLILCLSRACGVAPVRFERARRGCPCALNASARLQLYGYILITLLHTGLLIGIIMDKIAGSEGVRLRSAWASLSFYAELVVLLPSVSIGAYGAPQRLKQTLIYLDVVHQIKTKIGCSRRDKYATVYSIAIALYLIVLIILYGIDWYSYFDRVHYEGKRYYIMYFYICLYCELFVLVLLKLEFMYLAVYVQSGLKSINKALENLIYIIDLQRSSVKMKNVELVTMRIPLSTESVKATDGTLLSKIYFTGQPRRSLNVAKNLRDLMLSYGTICDTIAGVNDTYGWLLILFVASSMLYFILAPYNLLQFWYYNMVVNRWLELVFIFFHLTFMLMVVEPGYLTEQQNEYTQVLVTRLLQRSAAEDQVLDELGILQKLIDLNKVYYKPLQMVRLTRSLIITIVGVASTYLIIILQFQML